MKKIVVLFLCLGFVCFGIVGCASRQEKEIIAESKKLSNYTMDIEYTSDHHLHINETVEYVNTSDVKLNEIYFHLYPNNFKYNAIHKPVGTLYQNKAYPNGFSEGGIEVNCVKVGDIDSAIIYEGDDDDFLKVNCCVAPQDRININIDCFNS